MHTRHSIKTACKLVNLALLEQIIGWIPPCFLPILNPATGSVVPLPTWEQQVQVIAEKFLQSNKPIGRLGDARQSGNSDVAAELAILSRWASIFWMTTGSSILAMILTSLPHSLRVSISILKTRFNRCTHVIEARFSARVWSAELVFLRLPRLAGVTFERYLLLGANTPWKRVRLTLGFGISETSRAIKSNGSKMTWVIPLRQGVFSS